MKVGLKTLPSVHDLETAYNDILSAQRTADGKLDLGSFAIYCQWVRFDSRLGEICVDFLSHSWKKINPIELNDAFAQQPWPGILGVLLEFCRDKSPLFSFWKKTAVCGFSKGHWELFFIGKRRIGGNLMFDDARFSLEEYRRWGYLGREVLINKPGRIESKGHAYSYETRTQILKEMLNHHSRVTTQQYWEAIGKSISIRQAERDLKTSLFLRSMGNTKGRYFAKRKHYFSDRK